MYITLHQDIYNNRPIEIFVDDIQGQPIPIYGEEVCKSTLKTTSHVWRVTETPEEILTLIKEVKNA